MTVLVIATASALQATEQPSPMSRLLVEAATMAIWALPIASIVARNSEEPGQLAAILTLSLGAAA